MASLGGLSGPVSGIDTDSLIYAMMQIERLPLTHLEERREVKSQELSAWEELRDKLNTLKFKAIDLYTQRSIWGKKAVTSSDETVVTARATNGIEPATYEVKIKQLAKAQRVSSNDFDGSVPIAAQVYKFTINGTEIAVDNSGGTFTANDTGFLEEIKNKINEKSNITQVRATRIASKLVLEGTKTGAANTFTIVDTQNTLMHDVGVLGISANYSEEFAGVGNLGGYSVGGGTGSIANPAGGILEYTFGTAGEILQSPAMNVAGDSVEIKLKYGGGDAAQLRVWYTEDGVIYKDVLTLQNVINDGQDHVYTFDLNDSVPPPTGNILGIRVELVGATGGEVYSIDSIKVGTVNPNSFLNPLQDAQDAIFMVDGVELQRDKNTDINDVIVSGNDYMSINLLRDPFPKDALGYSDPFILTVGNDPEPAMEAIKSLVEEYNKVMNYIQRVSYRGNVSEDVNKTGGILRNDSSLLGLRSAILNAMTGGVFSRTSTEPLTYGDNLSLDADPAQAVPNSNIMGNPGTATATLFELRWTSGITLDRISLLMGAGVADTTYTIQYTLDGSTWRGVSLWGATVKQGGATIGGFTVGGSDFSVSGSAGSDIYEASFESIFGVKGIRVSSGAAVEVDELQSFDTKINSDIRSIFDIGIDSEYIITGTVTGAENQTEAEDEQDSPYKLTIDEETLRQVLESNPRAVENLFAYDGDGDEVINPEDSDDFGVAVSLFRALDRETRADGAIYFRKVSLENEIRAFDDRIKSKEYALQLREETLRKQFTRMEEAIGASQNMLMWLNQQIIGLQNLWE
ncbi:MAG: flagellar filament capping protein FliD [bacterium]